MKTVNNKFIAAFTLVVVLFTSCKKDFLNENPRTDLIPPNDLKALKALLEDDRIMNITPNMGELSADNYYMTFQYWQTLTQNHEKYCYTWEPDVYKGQQNVDDWSRSYTQVLNANVVLTGLKNIPIVSAIRDDWNSTKGSALFFRANAYYNLAQIFAKPYDATTADTDLGLPLRSNPDINESVSRSSVKITYDSILNDLDMAEDLVYPSVQYFNKNRPSKPAVLALKARVYLSMRNYELAREYADGALTLYDSLLDYNTLDPFAVLPFDSKNKETIFQSRFTNATDVLSALIYPEVIIDSNLLKMYHPDDLRFSTYFTNFFSGQYNLKGSYSGLIYPFSGLATDELYLIRAEANAFLNNTAEAINDLNTLLAMRYKTGTFTPLIAGSREEALDLVRAERRKELPFRGLRWSDLRRFNMEGEGIILERTLNGENHSLQPNDKLYVLPIPPEVIRLGHLVNNER